MGAAATRVTDARANAVWKRVRNREMCHEYYLRHRGREMAALREPPPLSPEESLYVEWATGSDPGQGTGPCPVAHSQWAAFVRSVGRTLFT
jgi:hypothetical protein